MQSFPLRGRSFGSSFRNAGAFINPKKEECQEECHKNWANWQKIIISEILYGKEHWGIVDRLSYRFWHTCIY